MNPETDHPADPGRRRRILVVDDDEGIHRALERILSRQDHEVDAVFAADEGLERLKRATYDLIISDLMMPGMTGIQFLRAVRDLHLTVPVMMITGYPCMRTAVQALRLGAVDYLAKPFTRQELLGPVNRALRAGAAEGVEEPLASAADDVAEGVPDAVPLPEPGARLRLRRHSWALCQQDGTIRVGIDATFLAGVGDITDLELPQETDQVEQGLTGIRLKTAGDEEHGVFMPVSGQVLAVNVDALADPASVGPETWLVELLPEDLEAELTMLLRE